jgi:hypothetical protein
MPDQLVDAASAAEACVAAIAAWRWNGVCSSAASEASR